MGIKKSYLLDTLNQLRFRRDGEMVCLECGTSVNKDNSVSNKGTNVVCKDCVDKLKDKEGLTFSEFCEKYIWN